MDETDRSAAEFIRCSFQDFYAGFYGQAVFSSIAQLRLTDSNIATPAGSAALAPGTVFDFGVNSDCQSGCPAGMFGTCEAVDNCYSCVIGACAECPIGTYRTEPGAVLLEQCLACPTGTFSGVTGAAQCDECGVGSYVTMEESELDGLGTTLGGEACVACPAGRESTSSGSVLCHACSAGESSDAGAPCTSW